MSSWFQSFILTVQTLVIILGFYWTITQIRTNNDIIERQHKIESINMASTWAPILIDEIYTKLNDVSRINIEKNLSETDELIRDYLKCSACLRKKYHQSIRKLQWFFATIGFQYAAQKDFESKNKNGYDGSYYFTDAFCPLYLEYSLQYPAIKQFNSPDSNNNELPNRTKAYSYFPADCRNSYFGTQIKVRIANSTDISIIEAINMVENSIKNLDDNTIKEIQNISTNSCEILLSDLPKSSVN